MAHFRSLSPRRTRPSCQNHPATHGELHFRSRQRPQGAAPPALRARSPRDAPGSAHAPHSGCSGRASASARAPCRCTARPGRALRDDVRLVWLAGVVAELTAALAAGLDAERRVGWRGFWLTLRARVLVVTHGFGDVNRYATRGGFVVQLWHGIPLKRLHLDSDATLRVSFLPNHRLVRAVLAAGVPARRARHRRCSRSRPPSWRPGSRARSGCAPDRVVVTGDPRDDVLLTRVARRAPQRRARAAHGRRRRAAAGRPRDPVRADLARRRRRSRRRPTTRPGTRSPTGWSAPTPCCWCARTRSARATTRAGRRAPTASGCSGSDVLAEITPPCRPSTPW